LFAYFAGMNDATEKRTNKLRFLILPVAFVVLLWCIHALNFMFDLQLVRFSVEPRTATGLIGILFFPLLHGDWSHIIGNSSSLLVLLASLRYIFPSLFLRVFAWSYFLPGIFIWFFGRSAYHLGASGMVYALVAFLFISGVIRVNRFLLAFSLFVVFLYGGMFWGIFPLEQGISWEGHLGGGIVGFLLAIYFRKVNPVDEVMEKEPDWADDDAYDFEQMMKQEKEKTQEESQSPTESKIRYFYKPNQNEDEGI